MCLMCEFRKLVDSVLKLFKVQVPKRKRALCYVPISRREARKA